MMPLSYRLSSLAKESPEISKELINLANEAYRIETENLKLKAALHLSDIGLTFEPNAFLGRR